MGGIYGDKPTTLARFKENYTTRLTDKVKKRLVLENDEICYNVDDLLPVCNELDIPM
jgi:UV DNA damage endonuclease